eukprot:1067171-Pleurochrysis_carterae.AAC.2
MRAVASMCLGERVGRCVGRPRLEPELTHDQVLENRALSCEVLTSGLKIACKHVPGTCRQTGKNADILPCSSFYKTLLEPISAMSHRVDTSQASHTAIACRPMRTIFAAST